MTRRARLAMVAIVVAVLAGAGAIAIVFVQLQRPQAPSRTPPASASPGASGRIAIYAFTAGTQYTGNPTQVVSQLRAAAFQPQGIDWVIGWRILEPTPGNYDWSIVDADLAAASAAGYGSFVEIIPGEDDPAWLLSECPTVTATLRNTGRTVTFCVPTSSQFLVAWTSMIAAFGARYDGHSGLTMVQATGCGVQGEMQLPDHSAAFWSAYGLTSSTLLAAWEHVVSAWRTALPHTPSSLAIEEPLGAGNSNVLQPLLAYAHAHFGAHLWVQQNGLRAGTQITPGGYAADLLAASSWTKVGWQMFGAGAANGDLATALNDGLAVHPSFYEVYLSDILDGANAQTLDQLRAAT